MFWDKFVSLCADANKAPNAVIAEIGAASSGAVTGWKNGATPRAKVVKQIADYFNVSTDYFLGESDQKEKSPGDAEALSAEDIELVKWFRSLPEKKRQAILALAKD